MAKVILENVPAEIYSEMEWNCQAASGKIRTERTLSENKADTPQYKVSISGRQKIECAAGVLTKIIEGRGGEIQILTNDLESLMEAHEDLKVDLDVVQNRAAEVEAENAILSQTLIEVQSANRDFQGLVFDLEHEVSDLKETITELKYKITKLRSEKEVLEKQLIESDNANLFLRAEIVRLENEIAYYTARMSDLQHVPVTNSTQILYIEAEPSVSPSEKPVEEGWGQTAVTLGAAVMGGAMFGTILGAAGLGILGWGAVEAVEE